MRVFFDAKAFFYFLLFDLLLIFKKDFDNGDETGTGNNDSRTVLSKNTKEQRIGRGLKSRRESITWLTITKLGRIWIRFVLNSFKFGLDRIIQFRIRPNSDIKFGSVLITQTLSKLVKIQSKFALNSVKILSKSSQNLISI